MVKSGNTSRAMFGKELEYSVFLFMIKEFQHRGSLGSKK
jgi:hypothetical protein